MLQASADTGLAVAAACGRSSEFTVKRATSLLHSCEQPAATTRRELPRHFGASPATPVCALQSAALIHCVTSVAAAVGPAAPHGPGPRSTAPSDPPPPKPSVNDKSVDRRLPDATLQAHLTHVPEIGKVVVVPKDHRRRGTQSPPSTRIARWTLSCWST
jgi:hypothetical protein